jgi:hypothetical protein
MEKEMLLKELQEQLGHFSLTEDESYVWNTVLRSMSLDELINIHALITKDVQNFFELNTNLQLKIDALSQNDTQL